MRRAVLFAAALAGCGGPPFSVEDAVLSDAGGAPDVVATDAGFAELGDTGGGARDTGATALPDAGVDAPAGLLEAGVDSSSSDPPDAGWAGDAWAYPDAAPYSFQPSPGAPLCDQDEDGFAAPGCTASNCYGGVCKGIDCDDQDPRAYPGEPGYVTAIPSSATNGDWNCNHVIEPEFPTNVNCSLSAADCDSMRGFVGDPPCGALAPFIQCAMVSGACIEISRTIGPQGCK